MIITEFVNQRWYSNIKTYYINKGYIYNGIGNMFQVKVLDLQKQSNLEILVKCDICGKEKFLPFNVYNKNTKNNTTYYGCSNICSMKKVIETNLKRYCVEYSQLLESKKYEVKQTNLKRYGVENPTQNKIIREKQKQSNLKKYGYEYASQNKKVSKKIVATMIERYGEVWLNHIPKYNANSIIYLDMISEKLNLPIQHALNGGEKKFVRYWVDGYIEEHNICIEWDEKHHSLNQHKERDLNRENFIKEKFNCIIIRIDEEEFLNNIDDQINIVINKIKEIINGGLI